MYSVQYVISLLEQYSWMELENNMKNMCGCTYILYSSNIKSRVLYLWLYRVIQYAAVA
jgi:hypothetical protein